MFDKFLKRFELFSTDEQSEDISKYSKIWQDSGYVLSNCELEIGKSYTDYHDFINFSHLPKNKNKFHTIDCPYHDFLSDVLNLHKFIKNYLCDWEILKDCKLYFVDVSCSSICTDWSCFLPVYRFSISSVKIKEELDIIQTLHDNNTFKYLYELDDIRDYDSYEEYISCGLFPWLMRKGYVNIIMDDLKNRYECEQDRCKKLDQICDTAINLSNENETLNSLDTIAFLLR